MEPIFIFLIAIVLALIATAIAVKRGRSGLIFFFATVIGTPLAAMVMSKLSRGSETAILVTFIGVPLAAVIASIVMRSGDQMAADEGSFRGKKKCPFCAESIRVEATRCKHCGSDLPR